MVEVQICITGGQLLHDLFLRSAKYPELSITVDSDKSFMASERPFGLSYYSDSLILLVSGTLTIRVQAGRECRVRNICLKLVDSVMYYREASGNEHTGRAVLHEVHYPVNITVTGPGNGGECNRDPAQQA